MTNASAARLPCPSGTTDRGPPDKESNASEAAPLGGAVARSQAALRWTVEAMVKTYGAQRLAFLTLTFADHVTDYSEAHRRWAIFRKWLKRQRVDVWVRVTEPQKSGRLHFHVVFAVPGDALGEVDWDAYMRDKYDGDKASRFVFYRSASPVLQRWWASMRASCSARDFGYHEMLPVRDGDAIGRYVSKYVAKVVGSQRLQKGARVWDCSRSARVCTTAFAWATQGGQAWREGVAVLAKLAEARDGRPCPDIDTLTKREGERWAFRHRDFIAQSGDRAMARKQRIRAANPEGAGQCVALGESGAGRGTVVVSGEGTGPPSRRPGGLAESSVRSVFSGHEVEGFEESRASEGDGAAVAAPGVAKGVDVDLDECAQVKMAVEAGTALHEASGESLGVTDGLRGVVEPRGG